MFFEDLSTIRVSTVLLFCLTCLASFAISYFQQSLELYAAFYRSGKLFKTFFFASSGNYLTIVLSNFRCPVISAALDSIPLFLAWSTKIKKKLPAPCSCRRAES